MSIETTRETSVPIHSLNTEQLTRKTNPGEYEVRVMSASMAVEGMRHPILLMPNGDVLKGGRRLAAAELLGWTTIPARVVHTVDDAVDAIVDSKDEFSQPRTWEQRVMLGLILETMDRKYTGTDVPDSVAGHNGYVDYLGVIACALATSGSGYKRARVVVTAAHSQLRAAHVVNVAKHALAQLDAGLMSLTAAHSRVRAAEKGSGDTKKEAVGGGVADDELPRIPPPSPAARSSKARALREQWIRALAAKGASTPQIADRLGLSVGGVRLITRQSSIDVPADHVLARQQRKIADPNKVVEVAVNDLDALLESLARVDVSTLADDQTKEWATRLTQHARVLTRVARSIKGVTQ